MRIPSQAPLSIATLPSPASAPAAPQSGGAGSGPSRAGEDHTSWGTALHALSAQAMQQPEVRSDLVAHFRSRIASGTYAVPASSVAQAMLADPLTGLGGEGNGASTD
ncbi:MAG TPA: flagellar biosynthesis anti-sigma factor FlgM [Terriglobales bacterium]|nr:flagellar biosynthesis anti-sigma factor FlgM [Terriglobales bacterium]